MMSSSLAVRSPLAVSVAGGTWHLQVLQAVRGALACPARLLAHAARRLLWPSLSALHWAAHDGAPAAALVALARRQPQLLERRDSRGRTPLFYAVNYQVLLPVHYSNVLRFCALLI